LSKPIITESDPGAVGAGRFWFKPSAGRVFLRNQTNTAWLNLCFDCGCVGWNIIQQGPQGHVSTLPLPPTPGHRLTIMTVERGPGIVSYTGFTQQDACVTVGNDSGSCRIFSKISDGSEQSLVPLESSSNLERDVIYQEWRNGGTATAQHSNFNQGWASVIGSTAINPASPMNLVLMMWQQAQGSITIAPNGGFGITTIAQSNIAGADLGPHTVFAYATPAAGAYQPTATTSSDGFLRPQAQVMAAYSCP
jgi:hypothetical protein